MLQPRILAEEFVKHVAGCPSSIVACNVGAAVEAWFQVELAHLLVRAGLDSVQFGYDYPNTRMKADLAVKADWGLSIIEIKCFVQGADSKKMEDWPRQLKRLLNLVKNGVVAQGVAVSTHFGYAERRVSDLVSRFYAPPWRVAGPVRFLKGAPLQLVVATVPNPNDGLT